MATSTMLTLDRYRRPQDAIPLALRWRVRSMKRRLDDFRAGRRFAERHRGQRDEFGFAVCRYELAIHCYPGQEARFAGKCHNLELSLAALDGVVVRPGDVLSFWHCVGRPTRRSGYVEAAALRGGLLVEDIGGSICLASTALYNIGLLSGLTIVERYCHSVDTYGENRYFELGRDAAVEFPYRDLRLRNDLGVALLVRTSTSDGVVAAEAWSASPMTAKVDLRVSLPADVDSRRLQVSTERVVTTAGEVRQQHLGWSVYRQP
ncbi:MAG: VanW family protein [Chloroflexi bacterium]|nr:VanW family protein [Chloroflexota bacterium]